MIDTPNVDWFALSPTLALLAVACLTLLGGVFYPRHAVRAFCVLVSVPDGQALSDAARAGKAALTEEGEAFTVRARD